jgi:hypothetical protein
MATQTLAEAAKFINDEIVRGVAEDIISLNPMFSLIPFVGYEGQGLIVNRELTLGGAGTLAIGGTINSTLKAAATFTRQTFTATKLIGDAEMDGLVQAQSAVPARNGNRFGYQPSHVFAPQSVLHRSVHHGGNHAGNFFHPVG